MEALARVEPSSTAQWTRERVELVKRTICPKGISDDAFALFMEQCKRSGLDPLLKEAFCVPRGGQHVFQPAEAGMLARAERFPDFKGMQASAAHAEDEILVDQGKGEVLHRFNPAKRKGALVGAWARVVREGKLPVVVWLDFAGYAQSTDLWKKIPGTMIEKCARVAALRKAYPEAFGGLYVKEEMPPEEEENSSPPAAATSPPANAPAAAALEKPAPGPVLVGFGPHKLMPITRLGAEQLHETIAIAKEKLKAEPTAEWAGTVTAKLAALRAEWASRGLPPEPEGGLLGDDDVPF